MKSSVLTEIPKFGAGRPALTSSPVGDLVLAFNGGPPMAGRGTVTEWSSLAAEADCHLWSQPSNAGWKGFPRAEIKLAGWQVWLLGELYGPGRSGIAETVAEVVTGTRPASELNGHFFLLGWEESRNHWHVWTNRFGTIHAYHAQSADRAALGTSFEAVASLASRRQLDWSALTGFFGFGFFPEDRTFYEDVRILRPATHYVFSAKGEQVSATRYWEWQHVPDTKRSYDDTVAEFAGIFGQVMADLLSSDLRPPSSAPCRIAIPISGGLDSRSTVAAVPNPDPSVPESLSPVVPLSGRFWSYSYGYTDDSVETRISQQVAAARELAFTPFTIKPYLFGQFDQILGAVEGFQDITQCRQAFVADELGQHADYVIAAHWGDVWLDDMGLKDHGTTGPRDHGSKVSGQLSGSLVAEHTLKKMAKRGRGWLLEDLCAPHLGGEQPEALLRQFVKSGMKSLDHIEDPDFRVKAFKTDHWSFRWTLASIRMFQAAAFPRLPFYDTRLADFFATVPSAFVSGRKLQIDYLKRFAPDLASIEWQARGADLFHYQNRDAWGLPKRAVNKAVRLLTGKKIIERNWEVQFAGPQGRAQVEQWLTRPGLKLHESVQPAKVQSLVGDFYDRWPDPELGYAASMLLTLSAWLERHG